MVKRLINIILLTELLLYIHSHTGTKTSSKLEPNIKNANQKSIFDVNIVLIRVMVKSGVRASGGFPV